MTGHEDILNACVELLDTFADDYDLAEFLHRLASRCVELVDVAEAGVLLAAPDGTLHYIAGSSERRDVVDLIELQEAQGPGADAFHDGSAVFAGLDPEATSRWPDFTRNARQAGFGSVAAVPLRRHEEVIGAVNLLSAGAAPLEAEDRAVAQALADIATIGILQQRAVTEARLVSSQLEMALQSRIAIEQAKGILAERHRTTVEEAFTGLRAYARNGGQRLSDVARSVIDGSLDTSLLFAGRPAEQQ